MKIIGADIISQTVGTTTSFFGYDGHGSTRTLTDAIGAVANTFHFDGYGMDLGWGRDTDVEYNQVNKPATDMLYSGEQYDSPLQMQSLRARYYDQNVGGFNRLDDFAGNDEDPQSLHKYAYTHNDPVNASDPSGNLSLLELIVMTAVVLSLNVGILDATHGAKMNAWEKLFYAMLLTAIQMALFFLIPAVAASLPAMLGIGAFATATLGSTVAAYTIILFLVYMTAEGILLLWDVFLIMKDNSIPWDHPKKQFAVLVALNMLTMLSAALMSPGYQGPAGGKGPSSGGVKTSVSQTTAKAGEAGEMNSLMKAIDALNPDECKYAGKPDCYKISENTAKGFGSDPDVINYHMFKDSGRTGLYDMPNYGHQVFRTKAYTYDPLFVRTFIENGLVTREQVIAAGGAEGLKTGIFLNTVYDAIMALF